MITDQLIDLGIDFTEGGKPEKVTKHGRDQYAISTRTFDGVVTTTTRMLCQHPSANRYRVCTKHFGSCSHMSSCK